MLSPISKLFFATVMISSFITASPIARDLTKRDTAEAYIFSNCVDTKTLKGYAAIFWYYPDFLPDFPDPQLIGYVDKHSTVVYAGKTTTIPKPFQLTATIPGSAATAAIGTVVSTNCSASSFSGPMAVVKLDGHVFYHPKKNVDCTYEYLQRDNQGPVV